MGTSPSTTKPDAKRRAWRPRFAPSTVVSFRHEAASYRFAAAVALAGSRAERTRTTRAIPREADIRS